MTFGVVFFEGVFFEGVFKSGIHTPDTQTRPALKPGNG